LTPAPGGSVGRGQALVSRRNTGSLCPNGGLDANWIVRHGVPTVTLGAGQNDIHTVKEWVDVPEFLAGCRMAVELATGK